MPRFLERFYEPQRMLNIFPAQGHVYHACSGLLNKLGTLIKQTLEREPLPLEQLCPVCTRYDWAIPKHADRIKTSVLLGNPKVKRTDRLFLEALDDTFSIEQLTGPELESIWLAESLPFGSLSELLTRPECQICLLILHLLSLLPVKLLLLWSLDQPSSVLQGFRYSMQYETGALVRVKVKQPRSDLWQTSGAIEVVRDDEWAWTSDEGTRDKTLDAAEQSLIWMSSNLSKRRGSSADWIQTADIDYSLVKYWLHRCDECHKTCHMSRAYERRGMNIRLIDVLDQCIVPGTLDCCYLALSYVWGWGGGTESDKTKYRYLGAKGCSASPLGKFASHSAGCDGVSHENRRAIPLG
jgi:hypothetical protein